MVRIWLACRVIILIIILKMSGDPSPPGSVRPALVSRRLAQVRPGQTVTVAAVDGQSSFRRRLLELGFVSGAQVRVVRLAPLGDPMEVQLHGYHLSIRRGDAASVLLRDE